MKTAAQVATLDANEVMNEANNASSVELLLTDIVKELTIAEGFNVEIGDAIELGDLNFNF